MRPTARMLALPLLLALAACGSDGGGGGPQLTAKDFRLVKVSGDGQRDTVALSGGASAQVSAYLGAVPVAQSTATDPDLLPLPFVVKVVPLRGGSADRAPLGSGDLLPTGPSFAASGTLPTVNWVTVEEGCGHPFAAATQPGDDSLAATFGVKGTKAQLCHVRGQTVQRDSTGALVPVVNVEFSYTQLPGPLAAWEFARGRIDGLSEGDTIRLDTFYRAGHDQYFNAIDPDSLTKLPLRWLWMPVYTETGHMVHPPVTPPANAGSGWTTVVPDSASDWREPLRGAPLAQLNVWLDGHFSAATVPNIQSAH